MIVVIKNQEKEFTKASHSEWEQNQQVSENKQIRQAISDHLTQPDCVWWSQIPKPNAVHSSAFTCQEDRNTLSSSQQEAGKMKSLKGDNEERAHAWEEGLVAPWPRSWVSSGRIKQASSMARSWRHLVSSECFPPLLPLPCLGTFIWSFGEMSHIPGSLCSN